MKEGTTSTTLSRDMSETLSTRLPPYLPGVPSMNFNAERMILSQRKLPRVTSVYNSGLLSFSSSVSSTTENIASTSSPSSVKSHSCSPQQGGPRRLRENATAGR